MSKRRIIFFAPYRQCETALYASAMASFLSKKLTDIRKYEFEYITTDSVDSYYSPLIDHCVHRVVSPNDFITHLKSRTLDGDPIKCKAVYWFDVNKEYLQHTTHCQNYLFGDYTTWIKPYMRLTSKYSATIFPSDKVAHRMMYSLIQCPNNQSVYPGSYRTLMPGRNELLEKDRIKIILSMCSLKNVKNRVAILKQLMELIKNRDDLFITLLMDGYSYKEEQDVLEKLGLEYSDRCLVLNNFSDFEYLNILKQNDVFVDLNTANGIGYLLTAALHQGLLVAGFDQMLYRDILADGQYGCLLTGITKDYGYGFKKVLPNWETTFKLFDQKLFQRRNILTLMEKRNDCPHLIATLESRINSFLSMWGYILNLKMPCYSFPDF
jgi:hypothetical protein